MAGPVVSLSGWSSVVLSVLVSVLEEKRFQVVRCPLSGELGQSAWRGLIKRAAAVLAKPIGGRARLYFVTESDKISAPPEKKPKKIPKPNDLGI